MTARRPRRPPWLPALAYLLLMPAMLWLGFWQLDKFDRQRERLAQFAAADAAPVSAASVTDPAELAFRRVVARGRFDGARQVLIDNIVREGRNGFYVVTPLVLDDGDALLVNRGWIPQTPTREPIGALAVDDAPREVSGRIGSLPVGGLRLGAPDAAGDDWPRILQFPTIDDVAGTVGRPLRNWVLLADPAERSGFVRDWRPGGLPPERHLGYAVQWFAMALALTVIAAILLFRRNRKEFAS